MFEQTRPSDSKDSLNCEDDTPKKAREA